MTSHRPAPAPVRPHAAAMRIALASAACVGLAALGACEQRPEPHPSYEAAPPPPPAPLAGAPEAAPSAAPPSPDASMPPPGDMAPPPTAAPPEGAPGDGAPPAPAYPVAPDQGLVAMAPIPNPEDGGPAPVRETRVHRRYAPASPPPVQRVHRHRHAAPVRPHAATAPAKAAPAPRPAPVHPAPVHKAPVHKAPAHPAAAVAAKPTPAHHERRASRTELRRAERNAAASNATADSATNTTSGDTRSESLRAALSSALARGAVLTTPKATGDQAADVTLTVPAGFYDTLKQEAGKQSMGDAAASANLDATLTGDGYAIIPAGAQAQPVRAGQPTTFHWTVTAPSGAKGPLRADVSAELLGGGSQVLALGAVDAQGAGGPPKWWGAALLALVVALGLGWLARSRGADARIAASRRRARRPEGTINGQRPLDLRPRDGEPPR